MNIIQRSLQKALQQNLFQQRIIILYGARQVGKTTLVKSILSNFKGRSKYYSADNSLVVAEFRNKSTQELLNLVKNYKLIVIDEAQRIENIGLVLKQIHDELLDLQIIATGSSSFDDTSAAWTCSKRPLGHDDANKINEPLTGRKRTFLMYPLSVFELSENRFDRIDLKANLEKILIYGLYPQIFNLGADQAKLDLLELAESYLFKDVLLLEDIRNPELLKKLLQALAFQIGSEVSFQKLAMFLSVDQTTIQRYIDLLEKSFIIFRLPAFSRNQRNELTKTRKIYFYDLGIRNSLIQNFNPLELRNDVGALWKNFLIIERMKRNEYQQISSNNYFWRNYSQQEIDFIEEKDGKLHCYEFKWNDRKKAKLPNSFKEAYPEHTFDVINQDNWLEFVG